MARDRQAGERRIDRRDHAAQVRLPAEQVTDEVGDVPDVDVGRGDASALERAVRRRLEQVVDALSSGRPVLGEVGLCPSEHVHLCRRHARTLLLGGRGMNPLVRATYSA